MLVDIVADSFIDSVKLLPFLFLTYLAMEFLEHKAGEKMQTVIRRAGKSGPFLGGVLGLFPQCGFSTAASNLYAGRIITLGTLLAVYLSTSDEMLPIMISANAGVRTIGLILAVKVAAAVLTGFAVDCICRKNREEMRIEHLCEHHHCHCEDGIWRSALRHTAEIFFYILLVTLVLNGLIAWIGEDALSGVILDRPVIGPLIVGLAGFIPNCAASVVITQLYLDHVLDPGALMAGLLTGTGVGYLVLLRVNDDHRENIRIAGILYAVGVAAGILTELSGIVF